MSLKQTKPKKLVLFDIDGTLILGGALWKECFLGALEYLYPTIRYPKVPFSGKTDVQICRELLADSGLTETAVNEAMKRIVNEYVSRAREAVKTRVNEVDILPGVPPLLAALSQREDVLLGLLTGNVKAGAEVKLSCVGLLSFFRVGVFGDDHWDRYRLPALAQRRVHEEFGLHFQGKDIVIIGDTVHDVNCGKSIGVYSIAVGTGKGINQSELKAQNPDWYVENFADWPKVLDKIISPQGQ